MYIMYKLEDMMILVAFNQTNFLNMGVAYDAI